MRIVNTLLIAIAVCAPLTAKAQCLPSAQAVWSAHHGSWATWRNIDGRKCWFEGERHVRQGNRTDIARINTRISLNRIDNSRRMDDPAHVIPLPRPRLAHPQTIQPEGNAVLRDAINERDALAERLLAYAREKWRRGK